MKFKDDTIEARFVDMVELAQRISTDMDSWLQKAYGIELTITATTSTSSEDRLLGRKTDTHRTRRAWDIRTRNIDAHILEELKIYTLSKWGRYGAVVSNTPNLIKDKSQTDQPHWHCQLNRKYALKELDYGN